MDRFRGTVRDLSHRGLGVVDHPDGRVFFSRGTWPGDEGLFEVALDAPKYSEAGLIQLLHPSPNRVESPCFHRGSKPGECGGCPWMIAKYEDQLHYKSKRLIHALEKRKVFINQDILRSIISSEKIFGYRNRVQIKSDGEKLGFVSEGTRFLAPIENCPVMNTRLAELFHEVKKILPREDLKPGENHPWFYLDLDDEMTLQDLLPNRRRPFRQGNSLQNEQMKNWLKEKVKELPRHLPVLDLYCGSGNFTEVLSRMGFENILAVEVQGVALEALRKSKMPGVRILEEDLSSKGAWARVARHQPHAKVAIVDPAREGILKRKNFFKYFDNLETIIYVSCELDSFARDAADFLRSGFRLKELTPLDLFPHTPHVEILSVFERVSKK